MCLDFLRSSILSCLPFLRSCFLVCFLPSFLVCLLVCFLSFVLACLLLLLACLKNPEGKLMHHVCCVRACVLAFLLTFSLACLLFFCLSFLYFFLLACSSCCLANNPKGKLMLHLGSCLRACLLSCLLSCFLPACLLWEYLAHLTLFESASRHLFGPGGSGSRCGRFSIFRNKGA